MSLLRTALAIALLLAGLAVSGVLLLEHHGESGSLVSAASQLCGEGVDDGCEAVSSSPYSKLGGVPIAAIGVFFYVSLVLLLLLSFVGSAETRSAGAVLALTLVALALVVDVMLLGVQALVIGSFCNLCLVTYLINGAVLLLLLPARHALGSLWNALGRTDGRQALAGWTAASLAVIAAIGASNLILVSRAERRAASILGAWAPPAPAAPATPEAAAASGGATEEAGEATSSEGEEPAAEGTAEEPAPDTEGELEQARQEARRLQAILDDPKKLQQYLTDKATREFQQARVERIELAKTAFKGPEQAPIRVVEYSDFLCPFCRSIAGAFAEFLPQSRELVAVYFKNYPLDSECNPNIERSLHTGACQLALGAVCAQEQDGFWAFHDRAFQKPKPSVTLDDVVSLAAEAGLDFAALERCMATQAARDTLAAQIEEGKRLGVKATPTLFVNGKRLPNINMFMQAINSEAKRLGHEPLAPPAAR